MGHLSWVALLASLILLKGDEKNVRAEIECHAGSVDLVFVMDQSGSVGQPKYKVALQAAAKMVDALTVSYEGSHVGFVIFDDVATVAFGLNLYYTNEDVKNAILNVPYSGGGTSIAAGMDAAITKVFQSGSRKNMPKVMIIVTDGQDATDVGAEQSLASQLNITTYAVGVGSDVNEGELVRATGDKSRVYLVDDYEALANIMDQICQEIATIAPTFMPSPTIPTKSHMPRGCPCNGEEDYMNVWLDMIFIIDSTNGAGQDFINIKELLSTMATYYPISQELGKYSRVAIVNVGEEAVIVANLTKYNSGKEMRQDLSNNFHQLGGDFFYPEKGLEAAQKMLDEEERKGERLNVKKVVIIFSTKEIECDYDSNGRIKVEEGNDVQVKEGDNDPCRLAAHMQIDGVTILTVALKIPGNPAPYINIATSCFNTSNSESMIENIMKMLCMANCYCLPPYVQYVRKNNECDKRGECVNVNGISLSYSAAQKACQDESATLTDILDADKQSFLNEFHISAGFFPYWVGMKREGDKYIWDSVKEEATYDYSNWDQGEPDVSKGDCVSIKTKGFNVTWASDECGMMLPAHFFSCQKKTCDSQNYCHY